jgi:glycosyltransferase involved in cell wall biosynthesis
MGGRMNLLIVSSWFPCPPDNGSKLRADALIRALAERHDITLLSFFSRGDATDTRSLATTCRSVHTVEGHPFRPGRLAMLHLLAATPRSLVQTYSPVMQALVDREAPLHDAALALQIGAAPYLLPHRTLPRVLEELEVGVIRNAYESQRGLRRARAGLTWLKLAGYVRRLVDHFDRTTVVSDVERDHLRSAGCDIARVDIAPNGVNRGDLDVVRVPMATKLIYPGAITYSANLDAVRYFIDDIYPLIRAQQPNVTLDITGDTGDIDVHALGHGGHGITFTGRVADVKNAVARSAVCVVPLRVGGGTRLKVLEAMALGTPVVSTSKGVEGLAVSHDRHVLVGDTPAAFAAHVVRLLNDAQLSSRLSTAARSAVAERHTWDRIGSQIEDIIEHAVTAAASRASAHTSSRRYSRAAGA